MKWLEGKVRARTVLEDCGGWGRPSEGEPAQVGSWSLRVDAESTSVGK